MSSAEKRLQRQMELWDYITARPHQEMTLFDVAQMLGRSPGHMFGIDMAAVRHRADDEGVQITNCYWSREHNGCVFTYLPEKQEQQMSVKPLRTRSRSVRTSLSNVGARARYVAKNAERREDRAYGRLNQRMASAVTELMSAVEEFENDLGDDGGGGGVPA